MRPTAFFKSIAGQIDLVKQGKPYVMFGDGTLAACKPISEEDLAAFIVDCVQQEDKVGAWACRGMFCLSGREGGDAAEERGCW